VQALAFVLFLLFIIGIPALAASEMRGDWLLRFSPLSTIGASVSSWQLITYFWPAAVLLVLALVLGRFFCGWLCPLGATLDIGDRAIRLLRGRHRRRTSGPASPAEGIAHDFEHERARRFKYYLLTACIMGAFLGLSFFALFDPLSIAARSFVLIVHSYVFQGLLAILQAFPRMVGGRGDAALRGVLAAHTDPIFQLQTLTLVALLGLLALDLVRRRFWCRYLCPLGALYALAGKPSLTKRSVSDACVSCGGCARVCPMSCISRDGRRTLNDECILCLQCQPACRHDALRFFRRASAEQKREVSLTRRGVLAAVASGVAAYPFLRSAWPWRHAKDDPLIRPPLAGRDTEEFLSKCVRCGQCMRVCPTQVIQPAGLEAGFESLWTPKVAPRPGYCEYNCELCARACPSGAIPRFSLEEKHKTAMGLAYVDTGRCIPWRGWERRDMEGFVPDQWNCGVCEEVCPAPGKAIHFQHVQVASPVGEREGAPAAGSEGGPTEGAGGRKTGQELRLVYVRPEACVGCGYCEAVCPVIGLAAIRVTGGFRELPAQAAAAAAPPVTETALPVTVGDLRLAGPKTTYEGRDRLFEYIDGAAEPYLTFGFIRVSKAEYTDGKEKLKVDLWEFKTSDDAFGAFAKDRRGEPADVGGNEGAVLSGSLWAWRGRFMVGVTNLGRIPLDQVRLLATAALDALNEKPAPRPAVCRRLPAEGLDPMSVVFMRDEKPLFNIRLADNFIPDETWGFGTGAIGAYGAYPALRKDDRHAGLLLIEYGSPQAAAGAAAGLVKLRAGWGEQETQKEPYAVMKAGEGNYCVIGAQGRDFAAAFFMPAPEAGLDLVGRALR
jgi:ferredoxin